ncbi:ankyrin repeat-containing domain protein [Xylaria bambusicola]|uniref:ankyrin repeat-containing domain protein n=1 Tax=Xylaria bambusicola TaxID=326684 RepID=UPI0020072065|nr:ankyrin repeat-containing domain protein [Xylaria bambusicola]KAI0514341.1 ankyrin repeat-containing domain protein [Xylaria bambusicola]
MPRPSFCGILRRSRRKAQDEGQSATQLVVIARPSATPIPPSAQGSNPANASTTPLSTPLPSSSQAATAPQSLPLSTSGSQHVLDAPQVIQAQQERETHDAPERPKPYASNADLWKEAMGQLDESGKHNIESLIGELGDEASDTKSLAVTIQEQLNVAFKTHQHDTKLERIIERSLAVLGKFLSAVDVAVSFDPVHAAPPWAVVRSVLVAQLVMSSRDLKDRLIAGIAIVASLLAQCDTYQQLYMVPDLSLRPSPEPLSAIKTVIVQAYNKIQLFLSFALEQQRSKIRHVAAVFNVANADSYVHDLSRCEKELHQAADICERHCNLSNRSAVQELLCLKEDFSKIFQTQIDVLMNRIESRDQIELLEWISRIPYGQHHNRVKDARTSDTCEWLLSHKWFRQWENSNVSTILWLQGFPGAGKTFLASKVIDHRQALVESSPNQEGFAFFYCDRNEEQRRQPLSVLQSYVRQLSTTAKNPDRIRKSLQDCCQKARQYGSDLSFENCRDQLLESINLYHNTTLVLDALDECEPSSRGRILETIEYLISKSANNLKVFISSRPDQDIRDRFLKTPNIEIQATDNEKDIQRFVREKITQHKNWQGMSQSLQKDIVETLFAKSQGMFQWAFLQINELLGLQTERAIRDRLGGLPTSLKEAYDEIYEKIKNRNEYDRVLADNAFKWVACACEPLTSELLLSAIRLDSDTTEIKLFDMITESQLLDLCNNLLVIDSERGVWRFSHLSVIEYFEVNHWGLQDAECHAASVCLKGLIKMYTKVDQDEMDNPDSNLDHGLVRTQEKRPVSYYQSRTSFKSYLNDHWMNHIQAQKKQGCNSILAQLLKPFLGSPTESSLQYRAWYKAMDDLDYYDRPWESDDLAPETTVLFTMCRFSLYDVLLDWWKDAEFDISMTTESGYNLLTLAAIGGCKQICEQLIKRGMEVNQQLQHKHFGSALAAAAFWGHTEIVRFLVKEAGADVNMQLQRGSYGSALAAAAHWGRIEIVEFLVEAGADVNMQLRGRYGNALAAAAYGEETEIVKFLVEAGADVNMQLGCEYGSALAAAAYGAETEIVEFLVEAGADVNMQLGGRYGSALAAAAYGGETETVKFLVKAGADVNMQLGCEYGSALAAAAYGGETEIVKFLVEAGADVNMQLGGRYGSALAAAAYWGETDTVEFLVHEAGADVNMQLWGRYGALAAATVGTRTVTATTDLLPKAGADANMQFLNGRYGNALIYAIARDRDGPLRLLIGNGKADVNQQIRYGGLGSVLAAAAYFGATECARLLMEAGAKVDLRIKNGVFRTAIQASRVYIPRAWKPKRRWWDDRYRLWESDRAESFISRSPPIAIGSAIEYITTTLAPILFMRLESLSVFPPRIRLNWILRVLKLSSYRKPEPHPGNAQVYDPGMLLEPTKASLSHILGLPFAR